jgi:hypothetical protein
MSHKEMPPRKRTEDSLTTRHIEQSGETLLRTFTTEHIKQKLENVAPPQNQGTPGGQSGQTSSGGGPGQQQGAGEKNKP